MKARKKSKIKICVYAIAKNEAKFAVKWYNSMKEADYVAVLDTGSTDNTVKILKNLGAIVETKVIDPWRFDVARNESMKLVPDDADVLVCTDLDEVFEDGWADAIRDAWIPGVHERGEYNYIWKHNPDGSPDVLYNYNKIHTRNWIWRTPVHEYLTRENDDKNFYYTKEKTCFLHDKITLHHFPDNTKSRQGYLDLLKIRVDEYPDDKISVLYLAREYWFRNQYENAIEMLKGIVADADSFKPIHIAFSYMMMGSSYIGLAERQSDDNKKQQYLYDAENALNTGIEKYPTYMENYTLLGTMYATHGYWDAARKIIEMGFSKAVRIYDWTETGVNWEESPLTTLGACYSYLGYKVKAVACFAKAYKINPNSFILSNNFFNCLNSLSINELIK